MLRHLVLLLAITASWAINAQDSPVSSTVDYEIDHAPSETHVQTVYICGGKYAYAYHSHAQCSGLNNCQGGVYYTSETEAIQQYGRVPCCICWNNVQGRCKTDNPYDSYGGGGGGVDESDYWTAVGLVLISASAFILSNDVYVNQGVTVGASPFGDGNFDGTGGGNFFSTGLRKTFANSALEYGIVVAETYKNQIAFKAGYVHNLNKNEKSQFFVGPTLIAYREATFGGVVGWRTELMDRLSFDVRYETTAEVSALYAGLCFTYQKEYFWKKRR